VYTRRDDAEDFMHLEGRGRYALTRSVKSSKLLVAASLLPSHCFDVTKISLAPVQDMMTVWIGPQ
jgi:hypothetical protein